ncbi:hypothetical protein DEV91_116119 [Phyllobacterium brassicacearum]|nr:hypothetical protein DEV91_116119 [Phyllobacterium brassicacearum]
MMSTNWMIIWSNCSFIACHMIFTATVQFVVENAFRMAMIGSIIEPRGNILWLPRRKQT